MSTEPEIKDQTTEPVVEALGAAAPATATETKVEAKPEVKTFTQEELETILADRLQRERSKAEKATKTETDRIAALEERALNALISKGVASTHDPVLVSKMVKTANPDLNADDEAAVEEATAKFLQENPWLVKTATAPGTPAVAATPTPGLTATGEVGQKLLTLAELDAITPEQLAKDDELTKLYNASRAALRGKQ